MMIVTVWIFFIMAIATMISYAGALSTLMEHNKKATMFAQKEMMLRTVIKFWVAFVVFAVTAGIIFGGLWR